jgi:hypothetical protein
MKIPAMATGSFGITSSLLMRRTRLRCRDSSLHLSAVRPLPCLTFHFRPRANPPRPWKSSIPHLVVWETRAPQPRAGICFLRTASNPGSNEGRKSEVRIKTSRLCGHRKQLMRRGAEGRCANGAGHGAVAARWRAPWWSESIGDDAGSRARFARRFLKNRSLPRACANSRAQFSICRASPDRTDADKQDTPPVGDRARRGRASGHQLRSRRLELFREIVAWRLGQRAGQITAIPINGQHFLSANRFDGWTAALGSK